MSCPEGAECVNSAIGLEYSQHFVLNLSTRLTGSRQKPNYTTYLN